ncbi:hypothetical protein HPP92_021066 [Vanilla planifolia]|uniref:RING-type E3 ubiquitin transferase n=1 Tax=Vanilla planifolia TaxID=51239 RepID=A0A835Q0C4_VANPL|nr:hypothetical protein HPP92_021066 [Vanilla planifolia]
MDSRTERQEEPEIGERRMLHIRLSKGQSADGGSGVAKLTAPVETVTVACPEHLVIADLPVAKIVGSGAGSSVRNVGRRSRCLIGDRIHFCVRCDFPIAIYGRLIPCEHAFCLACARNDPSCYLCDERVQKIQTIKMLEGIYICAAPHCLKSFLKKAEFETHVHETHADLLRLNVDKEGGNDINTMNATKPSSADLQKHLAPETSTARAPPRSSYSPSSNSQAQDREDRTRRLPSKDQPTQRMPLQLRPPPFPSRQPQPGDLQANSNPSQVPDRTYNWLAQPQRFEGSMQFQQDNDQNPRPETLIPNYPLQLPLQANYQMPLNPNQPLIAAPFNYPPFPVDVTQPFYGASPFDIPRAESVPLEGGSEQASVLGIPPAPTGTASFSDKFPRPWGMGLVGMPFQPIPAGQGLPDGFGTLADSRGGVSIFQGDYCQGLLLHPHAVKEAEQQALSGNQNDAKDLLASLPGPMQGSLPLPPPPPLPPPLFSQQLNRVWFPGPGEMIRDGQGINWQSDKGRFGNRTD